MWPAEHRVCEIKRSSGEMRPQTALYRSGAPKWKPSVVLTKDDHTPSSKEAAATTAAGGGKPSAAAASGSPTEAQSLRAATATALPSIGAKLYELISPPPPPPPPLPHAAAATTALPHAAIIGANLYDELISPPPAAAPLRRR